MNPTAIVLTLILLQQGLFAGLWVMLASGRMARRASTHWALATLLISSSLSLMTLRGSASPWVTYWLVNVCVYGALLAVRRGIEYFARRPMPDREHLVGLLGVAALFAWGTAGGPVWILGVGASALFGYPMARATIVVWRDLQPEFGRSLARGCALPFGLITLAFWSRPLAELLWPGSTGHRLAVDTGFNAASTLGFMAAGLMLNLGLLALVVVRMLGRLARLSEVDALTGLLNRRAVERRMRAEVDRLARYGQPYGVLSVDIDHFKRINDRLGHPAGDRVLQQLARTLQAAVRATDMVARTGGEEFWVLLPSTGIDGAHQLARRTLQAVRDTPFGLGDALPPLSVSIGVAVATDAGEAHDALMQRLDAALYRAKALGRDRVELAAPAPARDAGPGAGAAPPTG